MIPISVDEFAQITAKQNPPLNYADLKASFMAAVDHKKADAQCMVCGGPIWAIGSAICGWDGCFTRITGEADDSEDYEIDEVCYTFHLI